MKTSLELLFQNTQKIQIQDVDNTLNFAFKWLRILVKDYLQIQQSQ